MSVSVGHPSRALVLGTPAAARRIAQSLHELGVQAETAERLGRDFPSQSDPNAASKIKRILREFRGQHPGVHYLHPGVSGWAERSELLLYARDEEYLTLAPAPRPVSFLANKLNFLSEAERLGIPTLVLSNEPMRTVREIEVLRQKYQTIVLKSVRMSEGVVGNRVLHSMGSTERKEVLLWLEQLRDNLGEASLFAERYTEDARSVSLPFARLGNGEIQFFPMVDASLQFKYRKIIEFCPAWGVSEALHRQLESWSSELLAATSFVGVGALEFLVEGDRAYLVDAVPRLNTGFRLWERVCGTSAVVWQLACLGEREKPTMKPPSAWRAAIATRIYATDSLLQIPQPGYVQEMSLEKQWTFEYGTAELDWGISSRQRLDFRSDGLMGILVAEGEDRERCLGIAQDVLNEVWVGGSVQTNLRQLGEVLDHPWVREGIFYSGFIEEDFVPVVHPNRELARLFAEVCAAAEGHQKELWLVGHQRVVVEGNPIVWKQGPSYWEDGQEQGFSGVVKDPGGKHEYRVSIARLNEHRWLVTLGDWQLVVRRVTKTMQAPLKLYAQLTGRVYAVLFRDGQVARAHDPIVLVESLHALVPHALPCDVKLLRWCVKAEDEVRSGQILAEFERL